MKWTSSKPAVVAINQAGKIVAKAAGTSTITLTTSNGKKATCKVVVKKAPTKLGLTKTSVTVKAGKRFKLQPKFAAGQGAYKIAYKSSNTKVVTVTATGVVTAKKKGTATIVVKTYNGKKATCKITVK